MAYPAVTPAERTGAVRESLGAVHMHSDYSHDGRDSLEALRDVALRRGIAFVGLTDHAEDFEPEQFGEYVEHCRALSDERVQLIPGLEFRFKGYKGLHLLAFGLSAWMQPTTPDEFMQSAWLLAGLTAVAHPILAGYRLPESVIRRIDAVEVWNASYNTRYLPDPKAIRLLHSVQAVRPEVVGFAGLDQHDSRNDRETRVAIAPSRIADPLTELRAGHFTNIGRTMRFDGAVRMSPGRLRMLGALRTALDGVDRVQSATVRTLGLVTSRR